jgi:microcystin-dependent protein
MNPFLGEIRIFAGNFAPVGWALCNGQLLSIAQNTALFSLLGTFYGGDGITTFGLPNLQGRVPVHFGQSTGSVFSIGEVGGSEQVSLLVTQLPPHSHAVGVSAQPAVDNNPANQVLAQSRGPAFGPGPATAAQDPSSVTATGGGQPHNNLQPFLTLNFIIALVGIFPSRT